MKRRNKESRTMLVNESGYSSNYGAIVSGNRFALALPTKEELYAEAEVIAFRDTCKVALTKQALENAMMLSKYEEACAKAAPHRAADFAKIVDAYTFNAVYGILGGRRYEG